MRDLCRFRRSNQFMMRCQIFGKCFIFAFLKHQSGSHKWKMKNHIDFIKSQPIPYKSLISGKKHCHQFLVKINQFTVFPATILLNEMNRTVKMCDRNQRFNTIFTAFFKNLLVKTKSFLIRLFLISIRKNPCPCDRHSVCLKPHFPKHCDIFAEMVIHINGLHCRIIVFIVWLQHF